MEILLAKIFAIFWFLVACHDVLETFIFPKILGDKNSEIDRETAQETAREFMNLESLASEKIMRRVMIFIAISSALIHATGFYLTYIFGNFSREYESIFFGILAIAVADFFYGLLKASRFLKNLRRDSGVDSIVEDYLKANTRSSILHLIACIGIFLTALRLILELFFD